MYKPINLIMYIRANMAEAGPPLGTTLGNVGVNTLKFCKEFNEFSKDLPNFFILKVNIAITENKNFNFSTFLPSVGFLIFLLKKEFVFNNINGSIISFFYITLTDFLKLAKFKFPFYDLKKSTKILKGSLLSAKIKILKNEMTKVV
jgi:large subunit ribosomal protein L11